MVNLQVKIKTLQEFENIVKNLLIDGLIIIVIAAIVVFGIIYVLRKIKKG